METVDLIIKSATAFMMNCGRMQTDGIVRGSIATSVFIVPGILPFPIMII